VRASGSKPQSRHDPVVQINQLVFVEFVDVDFHPVFQLSVMADDVDGAFDARLLRCPPVKKVCVCIAVFA
jgi:hypothetical protein